MKKFVLALILSLTLFALCSCAEEKYPPVPSTEEEAKVVLTLKIEDKEYEVKYELYRALFLNHKSRIDGGNEAVWSGENKDEYINEINKIIVDNVSQIFAAFHLAEKIGFNPYSSEVDYKIEEFIKGAVEGDGNQIGHGSYDAFLESLKANNLNYSTATLLYRYALAETAIDKYYGGEYNEFGVLEDGKYEYTREDVENYYYSDASARILQAYFQSGTRTYSQMQEYRESLAAIDDEMTLAMRIIGSTSALESDFIVDGELSGIVLGRTALQNNDYEEYIREVFSLGEGELSGVITLKHTSADGYYVVYRLAKSAEHFEKFYSSVRNSYIDSVIGATLGGIEAALAEGVVFTENYNGIVHKDISID